VSQIVEVCKSCQSTELGWEEKLSWFTGTWRYLRCKRCAHLIRTYVPVTNWIFYGMALAAVIWSWMAVA
jgi:fumarate reductase subunit D